MTSSILGSQDEAQGVHLLDYWRVLWQGRYTILTVLVLVAGLTFLRVSLEKPIYEATASVEIKPEARRILPGQEQGVGAEGGGWLAEERYFATQLEVIRSRDVAAKAFHQLHLEKHPLFADVKDPVGTFERLIHVQPKVNTRLVNVSIRGTDPSEVRDWVNAVVDVYVRRNVDVATSSFNAIADEIQKGLDRFRGDLGSADIARMRAAADQELFIPENQQDMLRQSLQTYSDGLAKVNVDLAGLEAELDNLNKVRAEHGDILALPRFGQDSQLQYLSTQKLDIQRELERMSADKKPRHPEYLAKSAELQTVQQRIDDQIAVIEGKLRSEYQIAKANAAYLKEQIRKSEENAYRVKQKSSEYEIQKTDTDAKRKVYDIVAETVQRLTIGAQLIAMNNNIQILDRATLPLHPVAPRKVLSLAVGSLVGLLLGVGLVLFMDYLDNTVRSPDDVERYLGLSMLGLIPKYKEWEAAPVREAFQSLRTSILFSSQNRERRVLLLTSTGPQEGKSSTVAVLGRVLAGAGDRVVVLDCDLRRPTQHAHFEVPREPGVTNYLIDGAEGDYGPFLHPTAVPSLKVLTCGPIPPNPPDLIGTPKFQRLIADLRRDFDWVLIDSPPIASLADSVVLATYADVMILVIKHNHNDRDLIRRSVKRLRDVNVAILGAVINNVDLGKSYRGDYYYGAYYQRRDDDEDGRQRPRKRSGAGGARGKVAL